MAALFVPGGAFVPSGNLRASSLMPASPAVEAQDTSSAVASGLTAGERTPAAAALLGLSAAGLAVGAARVSTRTRKTSSRVERRVAGVTLPLLEKFDPLNLGDTDAKMDKYTEAEIKHGRVCMIAFVGYIVPEFGHFPGCESFENGLSALNTIPFEGWLQLIAVIGAHELAVKPRKGGMGAWDLGFGSEVLNGATDEEIERRQTVERNNGRLAMVAMSGILFQDAWYGKSPFALLREDGWWGPDVAVFTKDIPICMGGAFCAQGPNPELTVMRAEATEEPRMSPSTPYLKFPTHLDGWVGGEKGFDPMMMSDALPVYLMREAELKHGRVCMLASVGWIATDLGARFPAAIFQNVSTVQAHDKMVEEGVMGPFLAVIGVVELFGGWLYLRGQFEEIDRESGDFFIGKNFLPKDKKQADVMRLRELENGRLAMLAFSGICTQAVVTGKTFPFL